MRIGWSTPSEAFTQLMSGKDGSPPALALDIEYELGPDGKPDFSKLSYFIPKTWDEWLQVPVREWDMSINTVKYKIRVPTVIICPKFKTMIMKQVKPTIQALKRRDSNRCQYTGQLLTNKTLSKDHVLPRSKGGKDTWENLVLCHKEVNSKKGNRLNHEIGLQLLKKPVAPKAIPLCELIKDIKHPDHGFF
jgi:hypothetical protein